MAIGTLASRIRVLFGLRHAPHRLAHAGTGAGVAAPGGAVGIERVGYGGKGHVAAILLPAAGT